MMNEQVTIRPVTEADTDRIIAWRNAPSVMAHFIYRTPLTRKAHLNWLHNRVETGEVAQFVIYDGETAVGSVYLRDIDRSNQKCEYGIFIGDEDCRGKGIGTAAAKLALAYAFEQLQMNRVYLRVFADNLGAIRYEGTFRQDVMIDGVGEDIVFMAILREDWKKGE